MMRLNGAALRLRPEKPRTLLTVDVHDKEPSLLKEHEPKFCSPSPVIVTSPCILTDFKNATLENFRHYEFIFPYGKRITSGI
jgi:hypothetical protein